MEGKDRGYGENRKMNNIIMMKRYGKEKRRPEDHSVAEIVGAAERKTPFDLTKTIR